MVFVDADVQLAKEFNCFEILASAEGVREPLSGLTRVVAIEHGGHGIDSYPVDVIHAQPMLGGGSQKTTNFVASVVEDQALPVRVKAQSKVLVFEEMSPVEGRE